MVAITMLRVEGGGGEVMDCGVRSAGEVEIGVKKLLRK